MDGWFLLLIGDALVDVSFGSLLEEMIISVFLRVQILDVLAWKTFEHIWLILMTSWYDPKTTPQHNRCTFAITYGNKRLGMDYERAMFGMKISDVRMPISWELFDEGHRQSTNHVNNQRSNIFNNGMKLM